MKAQIQLDRLRVVLVSTRNPLNIGAAARAMSNFGFSRLRVVNPYAPAFREARSAVGASKLLASAEEFSTVADAVADCTLVVGTTAVRHRELQHSLRRLEEGVRIIRKQMQLRAKKGQGGVAILFGSEKVGLSNEDLSHCHWLMRIPTREENISMNLGQAVAVCLYETIRDAKAAAPSERLEVASSGDVERITAILLDALDTSGWLDRRRVRDGEARVRRLIRRLKIPARDAEVWLGILRQIMWKMRSPMSPKA
jgi:TrmH family RNA methyltransferase